MGRLWYTDGEGRRVGNAPVKFRFKLVDAVRARLKGSQNSFIRLLIDCLQTNRLDSLRQKWHNYRKLASAMGGSLNRDVWLQLFGMVLNRIAEDDMSAELTLDKQYPHVTAQDIDDRLDAEGNMICWRARYLAQGRAEGIAEGRTKGKAEGRVQANTTALQNLMETLGLSLQEAMNALRIPEAEQPYYREQLAH